MTISRNNSGIIRISSVSAGDFPDFSRKDILRIKSIKKQKDLYITYGVIVMNKSWTVAVDDDCWLVTRIVRLPGEFRFSVMYILDTGKKWIELVMTTY